MVEGTASKPNKFGVYNAQVRVNSILKNSNGGRTTFFNQKLSPQEVIDTINDAYSNCQLVPGTRNTYIGIAENGMQIQMYLDTERKIKSAFPKE